MAIASRAAGAVRRLLGTGDAVAEVRAQATEDRLHAQRYNEELLTALSRMEEAVGLLGTQVARLRADLDRRLPAGETTTSPSEPSTRP